MVSYRFKRWIERNMWHPLRQASSVVHPLPLLGGLVIAYLFAESGQMHEIYIATLEAALERREWLPLGAGTFFLCLLSATLLFSSYSLSTTRLDVVYAQHESPTVEGWLSRCRDWNGIIAALLPWGGLVLGLRQAARDAAGHANALACLLAESGKACSSSDGTVVSIAAMSEALATAMIVTAVFALVAIAVLTYLRENSWLAWGTAVLLAATILGLVLLPRVYEYFGRSEGGLIEIFRSIGSLGMTSALLMSIIALIAALSLLASNVGVPIIPLTLALYVATLLLKWPLGMVAFVTAGVFAVIAILGLASRHLALSGLAGALMMASFLVGVQASGGWDRAEPAEGLRVAGHAARPAPPRDPVAAFDLWLEGRAPAIRNHVASRGKKYPVFIVTAQGGGIYAAVSSSMLLAKLQDKCGRFAEHVFAISAVSGGAIGASTFQGLVGGARGADGDPRDSTCGEPAGLGVLTAGIMGDDHLAGLVGLTLADFFGLHPDRARALSLSFALSERRRARRDGLERPFQDHWTASGRAPALVLNSTWAETGYSVAFSPFGLHGRRDGTIFAFGDGSLDGRVVGRASVIDAAVTSARFPGVVPAFTLSGGASRGGGRWNFVDGGYADGSGAATALEIYTAIDAAILSDSDPQSLRGMIDLRLLLLTSAAPEPDLSKIRGSYGRDSIAPLATLLSVRERLTEKSIKRTLTEVAGSKVEMVLKAARAGATDWPVAVIELDHESFRLALGWTLSRATAALVSATLGAPEYCPQSGPPTTAGNDPQPAREDGFALSKRRFHANSCIQKAVLELIGR